ncbi:MAG: hypothetical protein WC343_15275 [Bacilli bacterium]|jgi:phage terminase large subunit-like protein
MTSKKKLTDEQKELKEIAKKQGLNSEIVIGENGKHKKEIEMPDDIILKLKELRRIRRSLTRPELDFIYQCYCTYKNSDMYSLTAWDAANLKSIKKRLFKSGVDEDMSTPASFLKLNSTMDYFVELNKKRGFLKPFHQKWLLSKLDFIADKYNMFCEEDLGTYRFGYSCPPRSSKTEILRAFIFRILLEQPYLRVMYVTNSGSGVKKTSSQVRGYLRDVGVVMSADINNVNEFVIDAVPGHTLDGVVCGGGLTCWTPLTIAQGSTADVLILDDIYKSREEAESTAYRDKINESFFSNQMTRLTNCGCVMIVSTRYHPQDLIAQVTQPEFPEKFEYCNLPAIIVDEDGKEKSYWPAYWSLDKLKTIRQRDDYTFQTLYMGDPRPRGGTLFGRVNRYDTFTPLGSKYVWGMDLAYSTSTRSDYTALAKMSKDIATGLYYVDKIYRWRSGIDHSLKKIKDIVGDSTVEFCFGGTEKSIVEIAKEKYGLNVNAYRTESDKYNRSLHMSSEITKVLFHASIETDIIAEIESFNGDLKSHDDVCDCIVTCFNALQDSKIVQIKSFEQANTEMQNDLGRFRFNTNTFGKSIDLDDDD